MAQGILNLPALATVDEFKRATSTMTTFRRAELRPVDAALKAYYMIHHLGVYRADAPHVAALLTLCVEARRWLAIKSTKVSSNSSVRRAAVTALGRQAWARLQYVEACRRKADANGRPVTPNPRALQPGFAHERTTYENSGKTAAYAASKVVTIMRAGPDIQPSYAPTGKTFDALTEAEFTGLIDACKADPDSNFASLQNTVHYLRKVERVKFLLYPDPSDHCLYRDFGERFDAPDESLYAMDRYGNLYSMPDDELDDDFKDEAFVNHSTPVSGKPVTCAGTLKVSNGLLTYISTLSGHYQPDLQDLRNALQVLDQNGIDLTRVTAEAIIPNNHSDPNVTTPDVYGVWTDASHLLRNNPPGPSRVTKYTRH